MKKIYLLLILVLTSCSNEITEEFMIDDNKYKCYALDITDDNIEVVDIYYKLDDYIDVFNLYTIHQNYIPIGYYINSSSNIELIDYYLDGKDVYYVVDKYITLINDIDTFKYILEETNRLLGYEDTFIILK
ncbi:MAG: hypothetical protein J6R47_06375 [Acholeplasmatales bacterium]|nr:hypothetical protein [Acholeplasmatales bacterium]